MPRTVTTRPGLFSPVHRAAAPSLCAGASLLAAGRAGWAPSALATGPAANVVTVAAPAAMSANHRVELRIVPTPFVTGAPVLASRSNASATFQRASPWREEKAQDGEKP